MGWGITSGESGLLLILARNQKLSAARHMRATSGAESTSEVRARACKEGVPVGRNSVLCARVGSFFRKNQPLTEDKRTGKHKCRSVKDRGKKNFRKGKLHLKSQGTPTQGNTHTHSWNEPWPGLRPYLSAFCDSTARTELKTN